MEEKRITLIAAVNEGWGIGRVNKYDQYSIPWDDLDNRRFFKTTTAGGVIICGRNTAETIPHITYKDKHDRIVIVVSNSHNMPYYFHVERSLNDAISAARLTGREIFICGGTKIYEEALKGGWPNRILLTHIRGHFAPCNIYFPRDALAEFLVSPGAIGCELRQTES